LRDEHFGSETAVNVKHPKMKMLDEYTRSSKASEESKNCIQPTLSKRGMCQIFGTSWMLRILPACERP